MGLQDFTYRLKAMAGDTAPHDELGVSGDLSGGTITLEDRGGGDVAWQVSGGPASVGIPLRSVNQAAAGGGMTIAMTIRMVNYGTVDNTYFIGVGPNAPSSGTDNPGLGFGRTSSGTARGRYKNETGTVTWSRATGSDFTVVLTIEMNYSGGSDRLSAQHDATSTNSTAATATAAAVDTFWVQGLNSAVIQVKDAVVWGEELALADREALRDNGIRATLDASSSPVESDLSASYSVISPISCDLTGSYSVVANVQRDLSAAYDIQTDTSVTGDLSAAYSVIATVQGDLAATYSVISAITRDLAASYTVLANGSVDLSDITEYQLVNNTGSVFAEAEFKLSFYDASTDDFVVNKTVTTDEDGLVGEVSDALLVTGITYDIKFTNTATGAKGLLANIEAN